MGAITGMMVEAEEEGRWDTVALYLYLRERAQAHPIVPLCGDHGPRPRSLRSKSKRCKRWEQTSESGSSAIPAGSSQSNSLASVSSTATTTIYSSSSSLQFSSLDHAIWLNYRHRTRKHSPGTSERAVFHPNLSTHNHTTPDRHPTRACQPRMGNRTGRHDGRIHHYHAH